MQSYILTHSKQASKEANFEGNVDDKMTKRKTLMALSFHQTGGSVGRGGGGFISASRVLYCGLVVGKHCGQSGNLAPGRQVAVG